MREIHFVVLLSVSVGICLRCVSKRLDEIQGVGYSQQVIYHWTLKILTSKLTSKSIELVFLRLDSLMI